MVPDSTLLLREKIMSRFSEGAGWRPPTLDFCSACSAVVCDQSHAALGAKILLGSI